MLPLLVTRLLWQLREYLVERGNGKGQSMLTWFHRQVAAVISMKPTHRMLWFCVARVTPSSLRQPTHARAWPLPPLQFVQDASARYLATESVLRELHGTLADLFAGRWLRGKPIDPPPPSGVSR